MRHFIFSILFTAALALSACGGDDKPVVELEQPVAVKVYTVKIQPLGQEAAYTGTVESLEKARLSTKIMGWVDQVKQDGEAFSKGATLVRLRSDDLQAKQAQATAAIAAATTHFENATKNLARIEALFKQGAATQKELDDVRAGFASAESGKIGADKMKIEVDELLKYAVIRAPFDGVVGRKYVDAGDMASPGQPILDIENASQVKIVAQVPENVVSDLTPGQAVQVTVEAVQVATSGAIERIVPAAAAVSRQFDIHVILDNAGGELRSGMFARVWTAGEGNLGLLVPQAAFIRRGQLQGVYLVGSDSRARLRWVRTGQRDKGVVNVLTGVNEGDAIILEPTKLVDGQRVEVSR